MSSSSSSNFTLNKEDISIASVGMQMIINNDIENAQSLFQKEKFVFSYDNSSKITYDKF